MCLDALAVEHVLARRPGDPTSVPHQIPALTRRGFADFQAIDILIDLEEAVNKINRVLTHYHIWGEWGPLPRSALPQDTPQWVAGRIERGKSFEARGELLTPPQTQLQYETRQPQTQMHDQFLRMQQELDTAALYSRMRIMRQQADAAAAMNAVNSVVMPGGGYYLQNRWY
jgi:hypothetical protein